MTAPTLEFMGYEVEWTGNDAAPCILRGSRGAVYGAMRCRQADGTSALYESSEWCYLVNMRGRMAGNVSAAKGNRWLRIPHGSQQIDGAQ